MTARCVLEGATTRRHPSRSRYIALYRSLISCTSSHVACTMFYCPSFHCTMLLQRLQAKRQLYTHTNQSTAVATKRTQKSTTEQN